MSSFAAFAPLGGGGTAEGGHESPRLVTGDEFLWGQGWLPLGFPRCESRVPRLIPRGPARIELSPWEIGGACAFMAAAAGAWTVSVRYSAAWASVRARTARLAALAHSSERPFTDATFGGPSTATTAADLISNNCLLFFTYLKFNNT